MPLPQSKPRLQLFRGSSWNLLTWGTAQRLPLVNGAHQLFDLPNAQSRELHVRDEYTLYQDQEQKDKEGIHTFWKRFLYILRCVEQTQSSPSLSNLKYNIQTNAAQPSMKTTFSLCSALPWRKYYAGSLEAQPGPEGPNETSNTSFCQREHKPNSLAACSCGYSLRAFPCAITSHYILMLL